MAKLTFSKPEGDREAKTITVELDDTPIAYIDILNDEVFQGSATMRRTMRFSSVLAYSIGQDPVLPDFEEEYPAPQHTRATGVKAAKAAVRAALVAAGRL